MARLRRHLAEREEHNDPCRAVSEVAAEFGVSVAQVREVIARADRKAQAAAAKTAAESRPAQVDIYRDKRAPIIDRLDRLTKGLNPHAPWRDPREAPAGRAYRRDNTPWENTVAGACVWLRKHKTGRHDCSSDLLWCIVMQERCALEAQRVAIALKHAWIDKHAAVAKHAQTLAGLASVEKAAIILVEQCVTGIPTRQKIPVHWQLWKNKMLESGEWMLWSLAEKASKRAVDALR